MRGGAPRLRGLSAGKRQLTGGVWLLICKDPLARRARSRAWAGSSEPPVAEGARSTIATTSSPPGPPGFTLTAPLEGLEIADVNPLPASDCAFSWGEVLQATGSSSGAENPDHATSGAVASRTLSSHRARSRRNNTPMSNELVNY